MARTAICRVKMRRPWLERRSKLAAFSIDTGPGVALWMWHSKGQSPRFLGGHYSALAVSAGGPGRSDRQRNISGMIEMVALNRMKAQMRL